MASSAYRRSPVLLGLVAGLVVGVLAATLVAVTSRDSGEAASRPLAVTNAAGDVDIPQLSVDCTDPRGDIRGGALGIPVDVPQGPRGDPPNFEVRINCGLKDNSWVLTSARSDPNFGTAGMIDGTDESSSQPHPNTLHVDSVIAIPKTGDMAVELKPKGKEGYRGRGRSNLLGLTLSATSPAPRQVTVDCLNKEYEYTGTGEVTAIIPLPFRAAADVTLKCDPLNDKRWKFTSGDSASSEAGVAKFFSDRTKLRLYPSPVGGGSVRARLEPLSGERFKKVNGDHINVVFQVRPYKIYGLGDSWTAAFGFYGDGSPMAVAALFGCRPGSGVLNDRCSSNSPLDASKDTAPLTFTGDYGFGNNISWAARTARAVPPRDGGKWEYKNYAVSGAEPKDLLYGSWAKDVGLGDGVLTKYVAEAADQADLTLLTIGGNPMLGDILFGLPECDRSRGTSTGLVDCAAGLIENKYKVPERLVALYKQLLSGPQNHVVQSSYMTIVPFVPANTYFVSDWVNLAALLNRTLAAAVDKAKKDVGPEAASRLYLVPPNAAPTGLEQGSVKCRWKGTVYDRDGSSVLNVQDQDWLNFTNRGFCGQESEYQDPRDGSWHKAGQDIWFNTQDLGTHLTRRGNEVLANSASDLIRRQGLQP